MPCETEEFRKAMDVRQPAYPATEYGGLVFVYIGPPDTEPLFPASTSSTRSGSASPTISKRRRAAPDRDPRARKPGAFGYRYRDAAAAVARAAKRVEQGRDPINTMRDPSANKRIPTGAWNKILSPAEATALPYREDL